MTIYVESNFVLELALRQEQSASCGEILNLCESGRVALIVPAFCLAEPQWTLRRRWDDRQALKLQLDNQLSQLARSPDHSGQLKEFRSLTTLLIQSEETESHEFKAVAERLLKTCEVIPLAVDALAAALVRTTLRPLDSIVLESVLGHLSEKDPPISCFLNRNKKDFDDPQIRAELAARNCRLIWRFDDGLDFVNSQLA